MKIVDQDHPFYQPLWRRILLVAVIGAWALFEVLRGGDAMWMVITGGLFAYALWNFIIGWPRGKDKAAITDGTTTEAAPAASDDKAD